MWNPTHVQVTVQRAKNLQNKGRKGTNDAFVLIHMGKEKYQTTVKEKAIDPEWYEECDLTLVGRDSDVNLTVFHRNVLGLDEFLGQTSISLQGIENFDRPFTRWYTLKGKTEKSEEKNRGELEVRIAFTVRRCGDTQSLNDLSIKKKKHSIKHLAASVGHQIQKLPSRSISLKTLNPQKQLKKFREKQSSLKSNSDSLDDNDDVFSSEFSHVPMKRHGALYSSTLSLPQSAMITSSIQEAESQDEDNDSEEMSDSSSSSQQINIPKAPVRKHNLVKDEPKIFNHGEWTNRILLHSKESPIARSETNLIEALRSESNGTPNKKSKFEAFRLNLRRHTLQMAESPTLSALSTSPNKIRIDSLNEFESQKNKKATIFEDIPSEVIQQYEKMNRDDLILLAIKQQADLERERDKISDLENYLDNLLVRVMETTPRILQKPYIRQACQR